MTSKAITFDDVLIVPKFSMIESRKDVDLSTGLKLKNGQSLKIKLPVISSNMDTVTDVRMANTILRAGAQACLHRFYSVQDNVHALLGGKIDIESGGPATPFVSIGLGSVELERAIALKNAGAKIFVIDVAHGAQINVVNQAKELYEIIPDDGAIIVGNFATKESVKTFLEHTGDIISGIKVGIGGGSACTTRLKTGAGYPHLSSIVEISNLLYGTGISVIADGGMKNPGDIAKALGAGANLVMLGGMLAGTDESPGKLVDLDTEQEIIGYPHEFLFGRLGKKYRGSASKESYQVQGKDASWRTPEGESFLVPYKGSVREVLQDIEGGLRSSFSYVGATDLWDFHRKVEFIEVSSSTVVENQPHGKI